MKTLDFVAVLLVVVGALNWGLVGSANFNLVHALFGDSILSSVVYVLVGVAGVVVALRMLVPSRTAMRT